MKFFNNLKIVVIGGLISVFWFFIPWLISHDLPLAILSGAFWLYLYIGYFITGSPKELRAEKFCHFSFILSIIMLIISVLNILIKIMNVDIGTMSLSLNWPLLIMGIILFILSALGEIGLIQDRNDKLMKELEET